MAKEEKKKIDPKLLIIPAVAGAGISGVKDAIKFGVFDRLPKKYPRIGKYPEIFTGITGALIGLGSGAAYGLANLKMMEKKQNNEGTKMNKKAEEIIRAVEKLAMGGMGGISSSISLGTVNKAYDPGFRHEREMKKKKVMRKKAALLPKIKGEVTKVISPAQRVGCALRKGK